MGNRGLGARLRRLRQANDLTQKQVADFLGTHESTISLWESEKREPDLNSLGQMARYYSTTCDYLIFGESPADYSAEIEREWPGLTLKLKKASGKVNERDKERIKRTIEMYLEDGDR